MQHKIRELAYAIYIKRLEQSIDGTPEIDWKWAEHIIEEVENVHNHPGVSICQNWDLDRRAEHGVRLIEKGIEIEAEVNEMEKLIDLKILADIPQNDAIDIGEDKKKLKAFSKKHNLTIEQGKLALVLSDYIRRTRFS